MVRTIAKRDALAGLASLQDIPVAYLDAVCDVVNAELEKGGNVQTAGIMAFMTGVMVGKQEERARRKSPRHIKD